MTKKLYKLEYRGREFNILELPNTDIFKIHIRCRLGASVERAYKSITGKTVYGVSHLIEHLAFKSPRDFSSEELLDNLQNYGSYNANTSYDQVNYFFTTISEKWKLAIKMTTNEAFNDLLKVTEEEFQKERSVVYNEVKRYQDDTQTMFRFNIDNMIRGYDSEDNVLGTPEIIETLTLPTCVSIKQYMLTEDNHKYFIVFDPNVLKLNEVLDNISDEVDSFKLAETNSETFKQIHESCIKDFDYSPISIDADSEQSIVHIVMKSEADQYDFKYIQSYIATLAESSLNNVIREDNGLTYGVSFYSHLEHYEPFMTFSCDVSKGNEELTHLLFKESISRTADEFSKEAYDKFVFKKKLNDTLALLDQKWFMGYLTASDDFVNEYKKWEYLLNNSLGEFNSIFMESMTFEKMSAILQDLKRKVMNGEYKLIYGINGV